jgi:hypothetical protein
MLVLAASLAFAGFGGRDAGAQVFRPRTGKGAVVAKAAPAPTTAAATAKKAPVAEAPVSKGPRASATTQRRPTAARKKRGKRGDSDDVKIDDDDEDVQITDD